MRVLEKDGSLGFVSDELPELLDVSESGETASLVLAYNHELTFVTEISLDELRDL